MGDYSGLRILLIGRTGQIGWELERSLSLLGKITAVDSLQLDLKKPTDIRRWIDETKPQIIVNAAAYTAVDKAETDRDNAMLINGVAPGIIGEEARKIGSLVIHYSTDYVFDGRKTEPYDETDLASPVNFYGKTKFAGEQALQNSGVKNIIFRTGWAYGLRGKNFMLTILRLAKEHEKLTIVNDQLGAPTWSRLIAEATSKIIVQKGAELGDFQGVYHLTCQGQTTWYEFAREILDFSPDGQLKSKVIQPVTSYEYLLPAKRPRYSVLDNGKLVKVFGISLPSWQEALRMVLVQ